MRAVRSCSMCFSTRKVVRHPAPIFGYGTGSRMRGGHTGVIGMCLRRAGRGRGRCQGDFSPVVYLRAVAMSANVEAYPEADRGVSTTLSVPSEESLVMQGGLERGEMGAARRGSDRMVAGSPRWIGNLCSRAAVPSTAPR